MKTRLSVFTFIIIAAATISFIQQKVITGRVSDIYGNPLKDVIIEAVPSSGSGSCTSTDGTFTIEINEQVQKLIFSKPGYMSVTEKLYGRRTVYVRMTPEIALPVKSISDSEDKRIHYESNSFVPSALRKASYSGNFNRINYNFNTEGYAPMNESGFRNVQINPLSTFSIDVDNASYSNVRRFINNGQMPPPEAVRIEEMINYFKYDYPEPGGEHPFTVYTELSTCPWNKRHNLMLVGLRGKNIERSSLPPSNIVFLIDVSGSMNSPNKLPLLKSAFRLLINELRPVDRVAIVVYAGSAGVVLESTPGNRKEVLHSAIDNLEAGGSTAGGEGLRLAYSIGEKNYIKAGNNRIILATDGDFNVGESSNGGIERLVEQERGKGIFMTVLGFGMGNVKDDKMELIADKGNGNYFYIDNLQEARKVLVSEFAGTLFTIAKDVKFQIEFNPLKIASYRLIGYENRILNEEDFNDDKKDAGEMGSGHNITALYELVPAGSDERTPGVDPLKYQNLAIDNVINESSRDEHYTIKIRYKTPDGHQSKLLEKPVRGFIKDIGKASENLRFAAAITEFGMVLRNSEFKGEATFETAGLLARSARGEDNDGFRSELIRLISSAKDMK
jgi:Ca-activated chloride channel homolog